MFAYFNYSGITLAFLYLCGTSICNAGSACSVSGLKKIVISGIINRKEVPVLNVIAESQFSFGWGGRGLGVSMLVCKGGFKPRCLVLTFRLYQTESIIGIFL